MDWIMIFRLGKSVLYKPVQQHAQNAKKLYPHCYIITIVMMMKFYLKLLAFTDIIIIKTQNTPTSHCWIFYGFFQFYFHFYIIIFMIKYKSIQLYQLSHSFNFFCNVRQSYLVKMPELEHIIPLPRIKSEIKHTKVNI